MSWSDNLKAYLGDAKIDSAFLYTIDGSQRFAETGAAEAITAKEVSDAVKAVASDTKFQGVTIGGTKYVYLLENTGVFAFKKKTKACLFFHGAACKFIDFKLYFYQCYVNKCSKIILCLFKLL